MADPRAYRGAMRALAMFNVSSHLGDVHCPTLVITGELDTTVPPRNQHRLANGIPGAQRILLPGVGHAATVQAAEKVNEILLNFLLHISY